MGTAAEREGVRRAIRDLLAKDRAAGKAEDLAHYKGLFPGFWDLVAEEHEKAGPPPRDGRTVTSGDSPPAPAGGPASPGSSPVASPPLIGPYRILRELGRGGMGVVYEAQDTRLPRRVALKVLNPQFAASGQLRLRFEREAELASKLDHPHICTVFEAGDADGSPFMAMRFVEGRPLSDLVAETRERIRTTGVAHLTAEGESAPSSPSKRSSGESRLDLERVLVLFEKAARALHHAHERGLIHRDIKPHNIMVTSAGDPVLLDFGLAREEEGEGHGLTQTGSLMGTPAYMSPEQLTAQRIRLDRRTDVYSLGVALYECLTLRLPFEAPTTEKLYQKILATDPEDPRRLNRDLPDDLRVVLETALEKDRDRRYQTAESLAEDLRRARVGEPIRAKPIGPLGRLWRWQRRNPAIARSVLLAFLSLACGLVYSTVYWQKAEVSLEIARDATRSATEESRRATAEAEEKARALEEGRASFRRARGLALAMASKEAESADSTRAFLLAREAVRACPQAETTSRLLDAARSPVPRAVLVGHGKWQRIWATAFSPSGDLLLTASNDATARLWDLDGKEVAVLRGHRTTQTGGIWVVRFSPDGKRVLTGGSDGTARLWDIAGNQVTLLKGHAATQAGGVTAADFSRDGSRILTGGADGMARIWDLAGKEIAVLRGHEATPVGGVAEAAFLPDGTRVLTGGADGTVRLWDIEGKEISVQRGHAPTSAGGVRALAISPDGKRAMTGGTDGIARVWKVRDHGIEEGPVLRCHGSLPTGGVASVAFSPDAGLLLTGGADGRAGLWDAAGRAVFVVQAQPAHQTGGVEVAAFTPGGGRILTAGTEGLARLWNLQGQELAAMRVSACTQSGGVTAASLSPDGSRLLAAAADGTAQLWDLSNREVARIPIPGALVPKASFPPSGDRVLGISDSGTARLWDATGREVAAFPDEAGAVSAVLSPSGDRVLTASSDGTVRLWDLAGRAATELRGHAGRIVSAAFSRSGDRVITAAWDGTARLWDLSGKNLAVFEGVRFRRWDNPGSFVCLSPAGDRVLATTSDDTARLWDSSGKEVAVLPRHGRLAREDAFSPDGSRFLDYAVDGCLRIWDASGSLKAVYPASSGFASFSPDGRWVLTGSRPGGEVRLEDLSRSGARDLKTVQALGTSAVFSPTGRTVLTFCGMTVVISDLSGNEVATLRGHEAEVSTGAFSADGTKVLTTSSDGTARVWSADGSAIAVLRGVRVSRAAFFPDGRHVLTDSEDGDSRIWPVDPALLLELADRRATRPFTPQERESYKDLLGEAGAGK